MTPTVIRISNSETPCSVDYFVPSGKHATKKKWVISHELFQAETNYGTRIMTPVRIIDDPQNRIFMMDAITGSLYDRSTGRCLTSTMLYMTKVTPKKNLAEKLMKMKVEQQ